MPVAQADPPVQNEGSLPADGKLSSYPLSVPRPVLKCGRQGGGWVKSAHHPKPPPERHEKWMVPLFPKFQPQDGVLRPKRGKNKRGSKW